MSAPLLERDDLLARLTELLGDARRGDGRLVLVGGEAGAGKSALVRRFTADHADSATVYAGGCEALFAPRPLGPFQDVAAATGGHLAAVVRSDARPADVLGALLAELRRRRPTIVVLEDLHWADDATLDVVRLLGRRVEAVGALILATYRDDEVDAHAGLRALLGDLATSPAVRRVEVRALSVDAVRDLAGPHGLDAAELHRRTGGNAFFVTEALASRAELPATVRDAVLARAGRLPPDARVLVDAVAVVPGAVPLDVLDALAPDHGPALEAALTGGTLVDSGPAVGFRHELARRAVESAIPAPRRVELHRRALAAFARRGDDADLARLAHHADAAGDAEAVLAYAPRAAARAARLSAHAEAASLYERALRQADALQAAERADLLAAFAYECYVTDRIDDAFAARAREVELRRALGDRLAEGDRLRWLSRLAWFRGRRDDAVAYAEQAAALLETLPEGRELGLALSNLAQLSMLASDDAEAVRRGERALALAERLGDRETRVHALNNVGSARVHALDVERGNAMLLESLRLALEGGLEEHAARAWTNLGSNAVLHRDYAGADEWLDAGIAYASDRDLPSWGLYMLGWRARAALERDRWADATADAREVLRDPRSAAPLRIPALLVRGLVRLRLGDPDADGPLAEAASLARMTGELQRLAPVAAAEAERAWLAGDDVAVDAATADALGRAREAGAGWVAGELETWRRRAGLPATPGVDPRGPWALELAGRPEEAAAAWEALGCRHDAALALAASAEDDATARDVVVRLESIGARGTAAAVARLLRARGLRGLPRPSAEARPAGLTARELEVLALLADGLRNAEIARRLVLSPKTVEHHVTAILRKLDTPTRGAAAALAVAQGMVPTVREDGGSPR